MKVLIVTVYNGNGEVGAPLAAYRDTPQGRRDMNTDYKNPMDFEGDGTPPTGGFVYTSLTIE